jgi:hypothetical protein
VTNEEAYALRDFVEAMIAGSHDRRELMQKLANETPCPAWEDGRHCFVDGATRSAGGVSVPGHPAFEKKRCACGAEVKRVR